MNRKNMGRMIASSSKKCSDILYASGFNAPDDFLYYETEKGKFTVVSILELARAKRECHSGINVINTDEVLAGMPKGTDFFTAVSRYAGISGWIVPMDFPLRAAEKMRANGIVVECADGDMFPERAVKRADEVEWVRRSMKAVQEAMQMVHDIIRESSVNSQDILEWRGHVLTCEEIRSEVEVEFKRKSFSADGTIIACGKDAAAPHNIGNGPVYAHQPIVADIFPRSDISGYWGDMTRTFCKGSAPAVVKKAFDAVLAASEKALQNIRADIPAILIHQLASKTMEEAGFKTGLDTNGNPCGFIHSLGHGVGLDIHEQPRLSSRNPKPLVAGNIVSVEPGLYYADWGGIRLEDLVLVRDNDCENFCTMPKELEIS